ncbi:MAG: class II fumarate hydratase, partial [Aquihabitans sp.]
GTSSNMNANEVIARLATEILGQPVHPNDQVNASQSSNDVFPSAVHLAATEALQDHLIPALDHLAKALRKKSRAFAKVVKAGRTHLMDAVPVTLGQEFGGYATQVETAATRLREALPRLAEMPLGGTAVGTGLNAPKGFGKAVTARLAERTGLPLIETPDHIAAQAAPDAFVETSGQVRAAAVGLVKVANDLRWMASGPRTGLGEIHLPDLQPGSSIMPGKVNPVLCEVVTQVGAQIIGNDAAVAFSVSQGAFELNTYLPVMARNLLESIDLLANASVQFADRCVAGIEADEEQCRANAEASPSIATSLNPYIGYEKTAEIIKESLKTGTPIRELVAATGLIEPDDLDRALDALALTKGGVSRKS